MQASLAGRHTVSLGTTAPQTPLWLADVAGRAGVRVFTGQIAHGRRLVGAISPHVAAVQGAGISVVAGRVGNGVP